MFLLQWPSAARSALRPGALDVDPPAGMSTDAIGDLLVAAGGGDRAALDALETRMGGLVRANIRRVLRDAARSDAATQQFFADVSRDARNFDPASNDAETWLLTRAFLQAVADDLPARAELEAANSRS